MQNYTTIRASMLPGYADCPRRAAAKQFRREVLDSVPALRETSPSIGAAVGTSAHLVAARHMQARIDGREYSHKQAVEEAVEGLREEIAPGCVWDDTTPSLDAAIFQLDRITRAYVFGLARDVRPLAVELELKADAGDGFWLTGHVDLVAEWPAPETLAAWIRDLKTGGVNRPYQAQLGAYSLLYRSSAGALPVQAVGVDWIKRTPRTRPQDAGVHHAYKVSPCERAGWAMIERIKADLQDFRRTGNPWCFLANPMSMMCSDKYCPAHSTPFCDMGTAALPAQRQQPAAL